jgi:rhodanese-related sulfurtransferase
MKPDELAARIGAGTAPAILDVRSRREYLRGHVPGAIHIPFSQVGSRSSEIPAPRDAQLVVYCGHGPRAWIAGVALRRAGFRSVRYLAGHYARWRRKRLPVETGALTIANDLTN